MLNKGTYEYRFAGFIANSLESMAADTQDKWNHNSNYENSLNTMAFILNDVMKLNVFAAEIAKTVEGGFAKYGKYFCSSKQAWVIACAAVENNINVGTLKEAFDEMEEKINFFNA